MTMGAMTMGAAPAVDAAPSGNALVKARPLPLTRAG